MEYDEDWSVFRAETKHLQSRYIKYYFSSCSKRLNSGVLKNALNVIFSPSQSFFTVATVVLLFRSLTMLFKVDC